MESCEWAVLQVSEAAVTWQTGCSHAYFFESNTVPSDICFHFCPGCGRTIHVADVPLARKPVKVERKLRLVKSDG